MLRASCDGRIKRRRVPLLMMICANLNKKTANFCSFIANLSLSECIIIEAVHRDLDGVHRAAVIGAGSAVGEVPAAHGCHVAARECGEVAPDITAPQVTAHRDHEHHHHMFSSRQEVDFSYSDLLLESDS